MLKQVVQDEELAHRCLVKDRSMPRQFVQDEALQRDSRKSIRDDPQMSRQVIQDEDLGQGNFVQDTFPVPQRSFRDKGLGQYSRQSVRNNLQMPGKSSRTRTLNSGTLLKIGTQYLGDSSRTKHFRSITGNLSGTQG